ncbi:MAG: ribosome biogenesis GTP-binding protein YihA/YsxC [Weeksellaceae bacterium]|nr:ribosome biogenesis GTP-binding protein YihA/YsxC [Weeksellaceae bacterium]
MQIEHADFVMSNSDYKKAPDPKIPEYAFIGRSNVGKSSLINMLVNRKSLAKTSGTPGKTQLINHFLINKHWYLVDLPGYGYAKVPKSQREKFTKMINGYILNRSNLVNMFVLVDVRHELQQIDLEFMQFLGANQIPFSIIFTKADKLTATKLEKAIASYTESLKEFWETLPPYHITSASNQMGKDEVLKAIVQMNESVEKHFKSL